MNSIEFNCDGLVPVKKVLEKDCENWPSKMAKSNSPR